MAMLRLLSGILALTVILAAQETGGNPGGGGGNAGGGGGGGGNPGGGGGPTTPPATGGGNRGGNIGTPQQNPQAQPIQQPIFITGRVLLDNGTPPPNQVVIERVCQNRVVREGYADSKGFFSFQLGQYNGVFADASTDLGFGGDNPFSRNNPGGGFGGQTGGMSEMQLSSCELRANLAGYRSDSLPMFNIRALNRNDVGVIILHYFGNVQGLTTSATSALAPKEAKKSMERATKALSKNDPDTAQKELTKAVELYPRFAEAWFQLGRVYERREHKDEALAAYQKAIAADDKFVNPYERLYLMAASANQWEDALAQSDKVLRLNPFDFPGAYYINAVANYQLKKYDAAEKSARESAKLKGKQTEPRSHYVLGLTLAQKGDFSAASEELKTFMQAPPPGANIEQVKTILADLDRLMAEKR